MSKKIDKRVNTVRAFMKPLKANPSSTEGETYTTYPEAFTRLEQFADDVDGMTIVLPSNKLGRKAALVQWAYQNLLPHWQDQNYAGPTGIMTVNKSVEVKPGLWVNDTAPKLYAHFGKKVGSLSKYATTIKKSGGKSFALVVELTL